MTATTALEQALVVWTRDMTRYSEAQAKQVRTDDAVSLGEWGVFSNRHISFITGLEPDFVGTLTGKRDKTGGRFNPEALPFIYDLRLQWVQAHVVSQRDIRFIIELGVSPGMLAKLTGISRTAIYKWIEES